MAGDNVFFNVLDSVTTLGTAYLKNQNKSKETPAQRRRRRKKLKGQMTEDTGAVMQNRYSGLLR